ncbi:amidohydrolase family protein, partial [Negativicoccus succinicivorans]
MTLPAKHHFVLGTAFHAPAWGEVEVLADALFEINGAGTLERVLLPRDADYAKAVDDARAKGELEELSATQYLLPGFVDLHIHAPQWENIGNALHVPLEDWLQKYTFPLEQSLADGEKAASVFADLVMRSLANGTTTALYYGTQNVDATVLLGEVCQTLGQRAALGKVVMDNPEQCPDYYRDASAGAGIAGTEETIERIMALTDERQLLTPVITP